MQIKLHMHMRFKLFAVHSDLCKQTLTHGSHFTVRPLPPANSDMRTIRDKVPEAEPQPAARQTSTPSNMARSDTTN